jgi:hypothetical protein
MTAAPAVNIWRPWAMTPFNGPIVKPPMATFDVGVDNISRQ